MDHVKNEGGLMLHFNRVSVDETEKVVCNDEIFIFANFGKCISLYLNENVCDVE